MSKGLVDMQSHPKIMSLFHGDNSRGLQDTASSSDSDSVSDSVKKWNSPWAKYNIAYIDPKDLVSPSPSPSYSFSASKSKSTASGGIYVFIHSVVGVFKMKRTEGTWGHGEDILMELLGTLTGNSIIENNNILGNKNDALINKVNHVFLSLLGSDPDVSRCLLTIASSGMNSTGKLQLIVAANNIYLSELPTMYALERFALALGPAKPAADVTAAKILYIHTKGVRRNGINAAYPADWRRYMAFFLVEHHSMCIQAIDEYGFHTCGVLKQRKIYAGNFWWTTAQYIQDRAKSSGYRPLSELPWNMDNRYEAEVGKKKRRVISDNIIA